jgi:beta-lactamase class A
MPVKTHVSTDADALDGALVDLSDRQPFAVAWYLKALVCGREWARDGDVPLATRSTRKVAIMMALLHAVHEGELALTDQIAILPTYQHTASGVTQHFLPGPVLSVHDAMTLMIIVSDNGCTAAIVDRLSLDRINAYCARLRMDRTTHRNALPEPVADLERNTTSTPRDQGRLLELILRGCDDAAVAETLGCSTSHCRLALKVLRAQQLRRKIPALLPDDAVVAHKDGTGPGLHHDTGLVFRGDHPLFVLCAYTSGVPERTPDGRAGVDAASTFIAQFSRYAWDALAGRAATSDALNRA